MKTVKLLTIAAAAIMSGSALAQVTLNVDDNIKVTAINGKEVRHGLLQPLKQSFTLEPGQHVITARYDRLFNLNSDNHDYLKSGNITVAAELADNQTYQLIMPNQPNTYNAAKDYVKAPSLAIAQNGKIIAQEDSSEDRNGVFANLTNSIGGIFSRGDSALSANQRTITAINQQQATAPVAPAVSAPRAQNNLDGFMQLWLNSSDEEREKIRQWIEK
ncbi:DUF2057 domain-containing protein [Moraxella sp. FZFQ2102]|uniref:DUF2057 domain-containing protein n=1 Tax=Moraxella sp. FZFQ2102 TaxID=2953752 RepID=UPI00209C08B0|nr:DUF2057 domain-containing protein [Moraxella sp. FZFQ2102]USZ15205.1 DUF2057 domain-containing protein [Moraxella sp. FZFQ2102]